MKTDKIKPIGTPAQWPEIAEAFRCERDKRTERQILLACDGLCVSITRSAYTDGISSEQIHEMKRFMQPFSPVDACIPYWYEFKRSDDLLRAAKAEEIAAWIEKNWEEMQ